MKLPRRKADLEETEVQQDLLVYNPSTDRALCLNAMASEIYRACDGTTTLEQLLSRLGGEPSYPDLTLLTLADFEAEGLLEGPVPRRPLGRREFLMRWGRAAAAAALVAAISIPTPVHAMSCGPPAI